MNSHDKSLPIPGLDRPLQFASDDPHTYLDRTIMYYGASGTGKTVLMKHIAYIIKDSIPNVVVICPTNSSNDSWTGYVPYNWIIENPTADVLSSILARQKKATQQYRAINDIKTLEKLFSAVIQLNPTVQTQKIRILKKQQNYQNRIRMSAMSAGEKHEQLKHIKETTDLYLLSLYKQTISKYRNELMRYADNFTKKEKFVIRMINFNHRLLLILDDCGSRVKQWSKNQSVSELFFEGRHYGITSFYAMQDDKGLPPGIRKNAFINFFTESSSATSFFDAKCNSMTKVDKKKASVICDKLFAVERGKTNRKKLIYSRIDQTNKFRYIIADLKPQFRLGCNALWRLQEKIPQKQGIDSDDDLFD